MNKKYTKMLVFLFFCVLSQSISGTSEHRLLTNHLSKRLDTLYNAQKFYRHEQALHFTLWGATKHCIDQLFFRSELLPHDVKIHSFIDQEIKKTAFYLAQCLLKKPLTSDEKKEMVAFLEQPLPYAPSLLTKQRGKLYSLVLASCAIAAWHTYAQKHPELSHTPEKMITSFKNFIQSLKIQPLAQIVENWEEEAKQAHDFCKEQTTPPPPPKSLETIKPLKNQYIDPTEPNYMYEEILTRPQPLSEEYKKNESWFNWIRRQAKDNLPLIASAESIDKTIDYAANSGAKVFAASANFLHNRIVPAAKTFDQLVPFIGAGSVYYILTGSYKKIIQHSKKEILFHLQIHLSEGKRSDIDENDHKKHTALVWYWNSKLRPISTSSFLSTNERALLQPLCQSLDDSSLSTSTKLLLVKNYALH